MFSNMKRIIKKQLTKLKEKNEMCADHGNTFAKF